MQATSVNFKVLGNSYLVDFPNNDQLIRIELMKMETSRGSYTNMIISKTVSSRITLDMIDMIAHVTVLVPKLVEDLKVPNKNLLEMNIFDSKALFKEYKKQLLPWITEWMQELRKFDEDEKE